MVADTHFGHTNIIKYCNRPFNSVGEMDEVLIERINKYVRPIDYLYHLGDFCFGKRSESVRYYLNKINCKNIVLILGNHDYVKHVKNERFREIHPILIRTINNQPMTLCHYSMRVWHKKHYGAWHLYGHSHGTLDSLDKSMDVGVDTNNFYPYHFDEIKEKLNG